MKKQTVIVVYGRMNPPTKGHESLIQKAVGIKTTGLPGKETKKIHWEKDIWHDKLSPKSTYFDKDTHVIFQQYELNLSDAKVVVMVTETYIGSGKKVSSDNKKKPVVRNPLKKENKVELIESMVDKRSVKVVTVPSLYSVFTEYPEEEYNVILVLGSDRVYGKERMKLVSKASAVVSVGRPETAYSSTQLKTFIRNNKLNNARKMVSNRILDNLFKKMTIKVREGQMMHNKLKK